MNLDKSCQLFFGCKIDSKLREALDQAKPGDRRYFEDAEEDFLRIVTVEKSEKNEQWIGKVTKSGLNATEIEDVQRNVVSILRRIASGVRISPSSIKIYVIRPAAESRDDAIEPSGDRGPYIASY
ncbi:MAG: hypothetical protein MJE77_42510 [Proteobacteria bacterium]|nr:hypothetical protein [Pseudomonadota bacterium]